MNRAVRLCVLAGLTSIATMMIANAFAADLSAEGCPAWLSRACHDSASSNKGARKVANRATKGIRKEQLTQTRGAAAERKQKQAVEPGRPVQRGERHPILKDQEKEVLFQQFLEWEKGRSQNTEGSR
jgi:hypothetical protein